MTLTLPLNRRRPPGAATGGPAPVPVRGATVAHVFRDTAADRLDAPALRHHDGTGWRTLDWAGYERAVAEVAAGLRGLGLEAGDRVGILSANRPEWHIADLGTLAAALVSTPVYATSSSSQSAYILGHSGARVCFVEDGEQLAKVLLRRDELPDLERVVVFDAIEGADDGFVLPFADLRREGAAVLDAHPSRFGDLLDEVTPDAVATIVYTSGTTGQPKGAVITHANVMATLRNLSQLVALAPTDRFLSFLPLSHITERSVSHFGQVVSGGETWFARSLATVPDDLRDCRPTLFFAVPRVWEKFHESVVAALDSAPPPVRELGRRYLALAERRGNDEPLGVADRAQFEVFDRTIGALVRHRTGLDRARMLVSGAAPIHPALLRWFRGIGFEIGEGYGQTEVTLVTSLNTPGCTRIGTVGRPIPGVEVRIAEDGEILVRGGGVCAGYWQNPDASAELIDEDGWLHTGDLGTLDADGFLTVAGRKKDLIINSYGKNISPSEIETALEHEPLIGQAVVVGDGRKYLTALLSVDRVAAAEWAAQQGRKLHVDGVNDDPELNRAIGEAVERVNAAHNHAEGIRKWRLLPRELTQATGELTPTLKVRRQLVTQEFADLIEEMYAE